MRSALLYSTTPPPSGVHGWVRGKLDLGVNSAKTKIERVSVGVWFKVKPCVKQQQRGERSGSGEREKRKEFIRQGRVPIVGVDLVLDPPARPRHPAASSPPAFTKPSGAKPATNPPLELLTSRLGAFHHRLVGPLKAFKSKSSKHQHHEGHGNHSSHCLASDFERSMALRSILIRKCCCSAKPTHYQLTLIGSHPRNSRPN